MVGNPLSPQGDCSIAAARLNCLTAANFPTAYAVGYLQSPLRG
jgi:hypothetical protein